jgi:4-aminobutyrate aminotransferase/(S)-3-amino-2-methylpropionate transaminase
MSRSSTESVSATLAARRAAAIPRGLAVAHPIAVARAEGARVWDADGHEYLDFAAGIGVLNVGHRHPAVVRAVSEQLTRLTHMACQVAMYDEYVEVAARLAALVGGPARKALLVTTGAEATENAVKIARGATNRAGVIAFTGAFHGRTMLALTMTASNPAYRQNFGPLAAEVYHAPYPYEYHGWTSARAVEALNELFATRIPPDQVAAVIIEPQLGEGGFVPAPPDFLRVLRDLTRRHGIVLVLDEIQSGFGRTGRMFGYEHAGIEPDIVVMAKGLAGGLPLAAVVGTAALMDAPAPGGLGGTYAGNALSCAAALAVLQVFEREGLVGRAAAIGRQLRDGLLALQQRDPAIGDVRGLGAMLAIELVLDRDSREPDPELAQRVIDRARERGLLLLKCGPQKNVVRFLPPLVATDAEVARALEIVRDALGDTPRGG